MGRWGVKVLPQTHSASRGTEEGAKAWLLSPAASPPHEGF